MIDKTQLIFHGEILPGHAPVSVKARLAALLKLPPDQIERVFSGQRIVLHKGLPASEVARYVAHLESLGVRVYAEPQRPPEPKPMAAETTMPPIAAPAFTSATPTQPEPTLAEPLADEMNCPKCNERQPKRTLCRNCSVDMKRFAEAQEAALREAREERLAATRSKTGGRTDAAYDRTGDEAGLLGLGFDGRLGRANYFLGGLLCMATMMLSLQFLVHGSSFVLFLAGVLISALLSLRLTVLRCHDKGWSGWLSLVTIIPYIGWLFGLALTLLPGDASENRFGAPGRSASLPGLFAVLAIFGLAVALTARIPNAREQFDAMRNGSAVPAKQATQVAAARTTSVDVEIFTTSTCGQCKRAKAYMNKRGIAYVERDLETDSEARREFHARGGTGVPYIFVRGQSMVGFDEGAFERLLAGR